MQDPVERENTRARAKIRPEIHHLFYVQILRMDFYSGPCRGRCQGTPYVVKVGAGGIVSEKGSDLA